MQVFDLTKQQTEEEILSELQSLRELLEMNITLTMGAGNA
jgi:hypothetical protein